MPAETLIGIEIGGTKLQLVTASLSCDILQSIRYTIQAEDGAEAIREQIQRGLQELKATEHAIAIGVGFGGPVNPDTGIIATSHQVEGWSRFPLKEWLQQMINKPVVVDNDANVAALAEACYGKGKGHSRVFYMTIGSGIGGGMVIDGSIYHGCLPGEAEVGHLRLDKKGTTLESKCSGWALNKKIRNYINHHPDSVFAQLSLNHTGPEATLLQPALAQSDEAAAKIVSELTDDMAFALSHVVHLFHPHILVLGGGLSFLGDRLSKPVSQQLPRYVMQAFHPVPFVEIGTLGEQAVTLGAVELARKAFLSKKTINLYQV